MYEFSLYFISILSTIIIVSIFSLFIKPLRLFKKKLQLIENSLLIVITGCDSGFGLLVTQKLHKLGFHVISTCITESGVSYLNDNKFASLALLCDVTNQIQVDSMKDSVEKYIKDHDVKLWCVINNAGIAPIGYMDWLSLDNISKVMEVNYIGLVRVIKSLLQILKKVKYGRIINISSAAGLGGFPGGGAYCASKHAVEGLTKCLRMELFGWDLFVTNINPGFVKTPLIDSSIQNALKEFENCPQEIKSHYTSKGIIKFGNTVVMIQENPVIVVDAIVDNVYYQYPDAVNYVGYQSNILRIVFSIIPQFILDIIDYYSMRMNHSPILEQKQKIQILSSTD